MKTYRTFLLSLILFLSTLSPSLQAWDKEKWYRCQNNDECIAVENFCGFTQAINQTFLSQFQEFLDRQKGHMRCGPNTPLQISKGEKNNSRKKKEDKESPVHCHYNRCVVRIQYDTRSAESKIINEFDTALYNYPLAQRVGKYKHTYRFKEDRAQFVKR